MSDVNTASNMVKLMTSDKKVLEVSLTVAKQSKTISDLIEDEASTENPILLLNITEPILKMVIQYCERHLEATHESKTVKTKEGNSSSQISPRISDGKLRNWDKKFVDSVDMETLLDLMEASTYLNIPGLLYTACKRVHHLVKWKHPRKNERFDVVIN